MFTMIKTCGSCKRVYYYDVAECIFCDKELKGSSSGSSIVKGFTEVNVPSLEHETVPYNVMLLQDNDGNLSLRKSSESHIIGERMTGKEGKNERPEKAGAAGRIITAGIIGTGVMSEGIAQIFLERGMKVILVSRTEERLKAAREEIEDALLKGRTIEQQKIVIAGLSTTTRYEDLAAADIVIESIIEDLAAKRECFAKLSEICSPKTLIVTNTSSLSITELSKFVTRPERFAGMHFFNPVPKMALVEVVKGLKTAEDAIKEIVSISKAIGKTPVVLNDTPAFIVNRVMAAYLNEAVLLLEKGVASKEDIDASVRMGLNHPLGPLSLIDLIGVDVFVEIMNNLHRQTGEEKYRPAALAQELAKKGKLGRKNGEGFFVYAK